MKYISLSLPLVLLQVSSIFLTVNAQCKNNSNFFFKAEHKSCDWIGSKKSRKKKLCQKKAVMKNCKEICDPSCQPGTVTTPPNKCTDSSTFLFKDKPGKSCDWVGQFKERRDLLCQNESVSQSCKKLCRTCGCFDDPLFYMNLNEKKTCSWIAAVEERSTKLCQRGEIKEYCPKTCGQCCEDDGNYTFSIGDDISKTCKWIRKSEDRKIFCNDVQGGVAVKDKCKKTCDNCASGRSISDETALTSSPTKSPTKSPTNSPTMQPTLTPTKSPSSVPTGSPTQVISFSPSMAPSITPTSTNERSLPRCEVETHLKFPDVDPSFSLDESGRIPNAAGRHYTIRIQHDFSLLDNVQDIIDDIGGSEMEGFLSFVVNGKKLRNQFDLKYDLTGGSETSFVLTMSCSNRCKCTFDNGQVVLITDDTDPPTAFPTSSPSFSPTVDYTIAPTKSVQSSCEVVATLSFPDFTDDISEISFHDDELSVMKLSGDGDLCQRGNNSSSFCDHESDGAFAVDDDAYKSYERVTIYDAKEGERYIFRVDHAFTYYEYYTNSTDDVDHLKAGVLTFEVNGDDQGKQYSHDTETDVHTHDSAGEPNEDYDSQILISMTCDSTCSCNFSNLDLS